MIRCNSFRGVLPFNAADMAYGQAIITSSAATSISAGVWSTVAGTFADGLLNLFTRSNGVLTYTGGGGIFLATFSFARLNGTVTGNIDFGISKGGATPVAGSKHLMRTPTSQWWHTEISALMSLATNDTVQAVISVSSGSFDITANVDSNITATQVG